MSVLLPMRCIALKKKIGLIGFYHFVTGGGTEADALQYCYTKGFVWCEDGVRLYELLDRVSCWCCGNKNLKELKNIYLHLPWYWKKLKELQLNTDRPYRRNSGETIFDLEERFKREMQQK